MKAKVTLKATIFHCEDCGLSFKSTDEDRKKCAICDGKNIKVEGKDTITTKTEVGDDFEEN